MTAADAVSHAESCECLPCKLRYWRSRGMQLSVPQDWRGPSVRARAARQYEEAKAAGYDPVPIADKYRWV
jgi:hypothetical protein